MAATTEHLDQICTTLDKLTLDALTLMEEEIDLKINAENAMVGGETHLAKTRPRELVQMFEVFRYILGHNSVSNLQLPTENSPEFNALTIVHTNDDEYGVKQFDLESHKPDNETYLNPSKWFGYLVPHDIQFAQNLYRQALQWLVQAANVQNILQENCLQIKQLKELKQELSSK